MAQYVSIRNLKFLLYEVFGIESLTQYEHFKDHNRESFDMILDTAKQIADNILYPTFREMDVQEPQLENGVVNVHPAIKKYLKAMGEAGMIGATYNYEAGGGQVPASVYSLATFILSAANNGASMFTGLSSGAARLIISFANQTLKDKYVPKMLSGEWQGTMALTEPQAGSSLSDITSSAKLLEDGSYSIKGQKVFISAGEHNQAENIIHLLLARIEGAPAGIKGISLFIVPKFREENGQFVNNDVAAGSIYHKMGQKSTPAMHLMIGDNNNCKGYLVGEANQGLKYMFQMMNEARLGVGVVGASIATNAYYASLQYAQERPQGRRLDEKDQKTTPQTKIINHPDVRRMLLFQKAVAEGALSLLLECARYADLIEVTEGEEKENYSLLLDILTPIAKTFPSEYGIKSVSEAMQVFGGYGYCEDFPIEQLYRDIRIASIYEGTTAIQSQDLLGRKLTMKNGAAAMALMQEISKTLQEASTHEEFKKHVELLQKELGRMQQVMQKLLGFAMKQEFELFLADANLFMEMASLIMISWQWLKQATVAKVQILTKNPQGEELAFYESKIHTMKFFFAYELPKTKWLATRLMDDEVLTLVQEQKEIIV
ncbi:acyl-CoA dehydrogenase [bacterium 336/3]|nr:acyl-CoA dehydrogenase [bacterium 336/3]